MRTLLIALLLFTLPALAEVPGEHASNQIQPPPPLPVKVETSLYLWKVDNIDEKNEAFTASIYLNLKWRDERLAFTAKTDQPVTYTEDAVDEKFQEIWWPEYDFVNAIAIKINNRSLSIFPDGRVEYSLKILGTFFTPMNFSKFPFDSQDFNIRIASFLWEADQLEFIIDEKNSGYYKDRFLDKFTLTSAAMNTSKVKYLDQDYSEFIFTLDLQRHTRFYLYQILIPLFIVLAITVVMFFGDISDLSSPLFLGQGGLLVLIAMKFMINETLPTIDYLTILDYIFFVAYLMCGITVAIACIQHMLWRKKTSPALSTSQRVIWLPIALFFLLYVLLFFLLALR